MYLLYVSAVTTPVWIEILHNYSHKA